MGTFSNRKVTLLLVGLEGRGLGILEQQLTQLWVALAGEAMGLTKRVLAVVSAESLAQLLWAREGP